MKKKIKRGLIGEKLYIQGQGFFVVKDVVLNRCYNERGCWIDLHFLHQALKNGFIKSRKK